VYGLAQKVTVQCLLNVGLDQAMVYSDQVKVVQGRAMVFQDRMMVFQDRVRVYLGQVMAGRDRKKGESEERLVLKRM
jgi:lipopolysaccharide export system protein LptA